MKHKTTFLALALVLLMTLSLTGCGREASDASAEGSTAETPILYNSDAGSAQDQEADPAPEGDAPDAPDASGDASVPPVSGSITVTPDSGAASKPSGGSSGAITGGGSFSDGSNVIVGGMAPAAGGSITMTPNAG